MNTTQQIHKWIEFDNHKYCLSKLTNTYTMVTEFSETKTPDRYMLEFFVVTGDYDKLCEKLIDNIQYVYDRKIISLGDDTVTSTKVFFTLRRVVIEAKEKYSMKGMVVLVGVHNKLRGIYEVFFRYKLKPHYSGFEIIEGETLVRYEITY